MSPILLEDWESAGHGVRPRVDRLSSSRGWRAHRIPLGSRRGCAVPRKLAPRVAPEAGPPSRLRHLQRNRMPQKRSQPAQKGAQSSLPPPSLSLSPVPRESRSRPRRGEAAARHLSNGIPVPPPCNLCKSPLIPSSLLRPLASCWPGMVAPAASLSSCPSCRRFSSAEAPCP